MVARRPPQTRSHPRSETRIIKQEFPLDAIPARMKRSKVVRGGPYLPDVGSRSAPTLQDLTDENRLLRKLLAFYITTR
jgi:hypothetical protein